MYIVTCTYRDEKKEFALGLLDQIDLFSVFFVFVLPAMMMMVVSLHRNDSEYDSDAIDARNSIT